ncbi:Alpha-1,3-mannosyltransferase-like protein [Quaeritorhiza haematococci]|nr:Alpha-1,3-mannosyltransferase-like protein [Quaeritorhiza haematococci]
MWFLGVQILFYCHFPDKLLATRTSLLRRIYRFPIDFLEEITTNMAHEIVVNSKFTAGIFRESFPFIQRTPAVLYPSIQLDKYQVEADLSDPRVKVLISERKTILSINRFERKKNIGLALRAFAELHQRGLAGNLRLVIAGGYDKRVKENVEHLQELQHLADELKLTHKVIQHGSSDKSTSSSSSPTATEVEVDVVFVPSFNEAQRAYLLSHSECLVYTPSNEHFGIVPVEAMYAQLPVIAVNSGGPTESIVHGETGFLCDSTPEAFADAVAQILGEDEGEKKEKKSKSSVGRAEMGKRGRMRVKDKFSLDAFVGSLDGMVKDLAKENGAVPELVGALLRGVVFALVGTVVYWWVVAASG